MLRCTGVELQLLTSVRKFLMVEQGIRGGFAFVKHRWYEKSHEVAADGTVASAFIVDANNLYGGASCKPLPVSDFRWVSAAERDKIDWATLGDNDPVGYIVEVDLSFPPETHARLGCFTPAPVRQSIPDEWLSEYAADCHRVLNGDTAYTGAQKLIATLAPRKCYAVHYTHLKLLMQIGVRLDRVRRVLAFRQAPFLKKYIDICTAQRVAATSAFKRNMWKLFINANYGEKRVVRAGPSTCTYYYYYDYLQASSWRT